MKGRDESGMAGVIIGLGSGLYNDCEAIRRRFDDLKGQEMAHMYQSDNVSVIKYKRHSDEYDANWFESDLYVICAVGTIIYNDCDMNNSVTDIAQSLYQGYNINTIIDNIDGHYLLFIYNKMAHYCSVITDIGGVINAYVIQIDGSVFISTSLLALAGHFPVTLDEESVMGFLRTGMFFNDTTYFKEITCLKPASIYHYDSVGGKYQQKEYWRLPIHVNESIALENAANLLENSLGAIISKIPTEHAIFDFTGGFDSRFVLTFVYNRANEKEKIQTFFFGPRNSREARIVEKSCKNIGFSYNNYELPHNWDTMFYNFVLESLSLCDGMINACEYAPVLWVQKEKAKRFVYSVTGLFGELYRTFMAEQEFIMVGRKKPANLERYIKYRNLSSAFDNSVLSPKAKSFTDNYPLYLLEILKGTISHLDDDAPNTLQLDHIYFSHRMRRWGGRSVSTTNQLIRPICPLWFRKPLNLAFTLPYSIKGHEKLMRYIAQRIAPKLAQEKMISGSPFLEFDISNAFQFLPGLLFYILKAFRKGMEVIFKKFILIGLTTPDYNVLPWYQAVLNDSRCRELLNWDHMISKYFYKKQELEDLLNKLKNGKSGCYSQLGNIITIEFVLRYANLKNRQKMSDEENN